MQELISKNIEFQSDLSKLEEYILFNQENENANYRKNRDIVYGAIINRNYTLWETFIKNIFYIYFTLKKQDYFDGNTLVEKYKLHELPGFLFESAIFDLENNRISFDLNKEVLSYTSKNMDMSELRKLFNRIDLDIQSKLNKESELKDAVYSFEVSFEDGLFDGDKVTQVLKRVIQERNLVSHYAHIDSFQSIEILQEWIKYFKLLGNTILKITCLEYGTTLHQHKKSIGTCKDVYGNDLLLIDIDENIQIDKDTKIFVYSNDSLIDIVTPYSFKVNDEEVDLVCDYNKAGIKVKTIFNHKTKIKKEYSYYLIEGKL